MNITLELIERFHEKWMLNEESGCWEWQAATMGRGYGFIKIPGTRKQINAHRLSYLIHYSSIPDDKIVCHSCDNPKCVKPSHLFLGTQSENLTDMKSKGRHLNGEKNTESKLTEGMVRQIHNLAKQGVSQSKIGRSYGVGQGTVWKILHGQRWKHVFDEIHGSESSASD